MLNAVAKSHSQILRKNGTLSIKVSPSKEDIFLITIYGLYIASLTWLIMYRNQTDMPKLGTNNTQLLGYKSTEQKNYPGALFTKQLTQILRFLRNF